MHVLGARPPDSIREIAKGMFQFYIGGAPKRESELGAKFTPKKRLGFF